MQFEIVIKSFLYKFHRNGVLDLLQQAKFLYSEQHGEIYFLRMHFYSMQFLLKVGQIAYSFVNVLQYKESCKNKKTDASNY